MNSSSRPGAAAPEGAVSRRLRPPASGVLWRAAAISLAAGLANAPLSAQFPPPARPPRTAPAQPASDQGAAGSSAIKLPAARDILDRHVKAMGGREAVLRHTSTHARGTLSMPSSGLNGTVEVFGARPNKTLLKITVGGVGEVLEGFDGTHGWSLSPLTGPMLLEGTQLEEKRFDSDYYSELRRKDRYTSIETVERTDFEGRPCFKVKLVRSSGREDIEFYDVDTGLKAGSINTRQTHMGPVTGTTIEGDYRKFGDLLQPSRVRSRIGAVEQLITITSIEYDRVPASTFDLPVAIKALLK